MVGAAGLRCEAGLDATAERSRAKAIETWPMQSSLFARKKDHNRAEAALLGKWALDSGQKVNNSAQTHKIIEKPV